MRSMGSNDKKRSQIYDPRQKILPGRTRMWRSAGPNNALQ